MVYMYPNIYEQYNYAIMYLNFGYLKIINFPFGTNGKFIILAVPIQSPYLLIRPGPLCIYKVPLIL